MQNISSFALYGFPESHAASFALIAYASAYFKVKYLAAFTCAILNNQPMGFYSPAVLVKDAQRHGLRVKPIDVQVSDWPCTIEHEPMERCPYGLGLGYAKGLRKQSAEALVASRMTGWSISFGGRPCPACSIARTKRTELLALIGALKHRWNRTSPRCSLAGGTRRQAGRAAAAAASEWLRDDSEVRPLQQMNTEERLVADYAGTGSRLGNIPCTIDARSCGARASGQPKSCKIAGMENLYEPQAASSRGRDPELQRASSFFRWKMRPALPM